MHVVMNRRVISREAALVWYMEEIFGLKLAVIAAAVRGLRRGTVAVDLDNPDIEKVLASFYRDAKRHPDRIEKTQVPGFEWKCECLLPSLSGVPQAQPGARVRVRFVLGRRRLLARWLS
jgi:hypothetical protein